MKKGDFLKIEYEGRILFTGEIFDTTSEASAKEENIYNQHYKYGPVLVVLGEGMVVPGVEKQLFEMKLGEEKEFVVKPEEAFGKRDIKLIQIISMSKFIKEKINPAPGMFVNIDNRRAKIQSVSGGRVRADFNHPLAGKELSYRLKITKVITDIGEKIASVIGYYGLKADSSFQEGIVSVKTEKPLNENVQKLISESIKKWIKGVKDVKFLSNETKNNNIQESTKDDEKL